MIRRSEGEHFLLIAQHDHALLAGQLSRQFGNDAFSRPDPFEPAARGVSLHDCGWPLHDDEPTINRDGLPLDVFETPQPIALRVWTASAERAAKEDAYAGLLVSLHVLSLSVLATNPPPELDREKWNLDNPADQFAVIKFQQKEIERQGQLRLTLGLRSEKQTLHRMPMEVAQKKEDALTFNLKMLQAMDVISLAACCSGFGVRGSGIGSEKTKSELPIPETRFPIPDTRELLPRPGGSPMRLKLQRRGHDVLVDPWPFGVKEIELKIPAKRIPAASYASDEALRMAVRSAMSETIHSRVLPG